MYTQLSAHTVSAPVSVQGACLFFRVKKGALIWSQGDAYFVVQIAWSAYISGSIYTLQQ